MKECQAITKGGTACAANGVHIVMVWALNSVAYPQDKLPQLYSNHGWTLQALNFCGAHRNVLIGGKPVNISVVNLATADKPKEGINMTKVNTNKVFGCYCNGSGTDPDFGAPCKCTQEAPKVNDITEKQAKYLADLIVAITAVMKVDISWANVSSKKEASEIIGLLKEIKSMVFILKAKKKANKVTADQVESIRDKINAKPTTEWVKRATNKLVTL